MNALTPGRSRTYLFLSASLSAVRKAINENLPDGYEEGMQFGMIGWYVPLSVYPAGYGVSNERFRFSGFQHFRRAHGQLPGGEGALGQGKEGETNEVIPNS
jgi:hypothetical protein